MYFEYMMKTQQFYDYLVDHGIPKEDARYILPNACSTSIVVTMNARSLFNFFKHRCCNRAQEEIRNLANEMLRLCKEVAPQIFKYAGPSCVMLGRCPEGKMSCGKANEMKEKYRIKETNTNESELQDK